MRESWWKIPPPPPQLNPIVAGIRPHLLLATDKAYNLNGVIVGQHQSHIDSILFVTLCQHMNLKNK